MLRHKTSVRAKDGIVVVQKGFGATNTAKRPVTKIGSSTNS